MSQRIDVCTNDLSGSDLVGTDIYTRGVGGSELSLICWSEAAVRAGYEVRIYSGCSEPTTVNGATYLPHSHFHPKAPRQIFVAFRTPPLNLEAVIGRRIHWMHDAKARFDYSRQAWPFVDHVVVSSSAHFAHCRKVHQLDPRKGRVIDLGVRLEDYGHMTVKDEKLFVFSSVPHRGVLVLKELWPRITERIGDAQLVITSDYRLWRLSPGDQEYRDSLHDLRGMQYCGMLPRVELVRLQQKAAFLLYPCVYPEMFCITVAEAQVAGAIPITSNLAALSTTNEWGVKVAGALSCSIDYDRFADAVASEVLRRTVDVSAMREAARRRFDWDRVFGEWQKLWR